MERADVMIIRMISPTAMLTICRLIDCRIIVAQVNATLTASRALAPARSYIQEPVRRGSISSPSVIHSRHDDFALEIAPRMETSSRPGGRGVDRRFADDPKLPKEYWPSS